jgi:hypothetical protein
MKKRTQRPIKKRFQQGGGIFPTTSIDPGHEELMNDGSMVSVPLNRYETEDPNDPTYRTLNEDWQSGLQRTFNPLSQRSFDDRSDFIQQNKPKYIDDLRNRISSINPDRGFLEHNESLNQAGYEGTNKWNTNDKRTYSDNVNRIQGNEDFYNPYLKYSLRNESYKNDKLLYKDSDNKVFTGFNQAQLDLPIPMLRGKKRGNLNSIRTGSPILESYKGNIQGTPSNLNPGTAKLSFQDESPALNRSSMNSIYPQNYPFPNSNTPNILGTPASRTQEDYPINRGNNKMDSIFPSQSFLPEGVSQFNPTSLGAPIQKIGMTSIPNPSSPNYKPNIIGQQTNLQQPFVRPSLNSMQSERYPSGSKPNILGVPTSMQQTQMVKPSYTTHPIEVYDKRGKFLRKEFIGNDKGVADHKYIGNHHYAPRGGNSYIDTTFRKGGLAKFIGGGENDWHHNVDNIPFPPNNWFSPMLPKQTSIFGQFGQENNIGMLNSSPQNIQTSSGQDSQQQVQHQKRNIQFLQNTNPYTSLIPGMGVSLLNKLSYNAPNSYDNAQKNFYKQQSSFDSLNKNLYSTNQDLYGRFDLGGEYKNIQNQYEKSLSLINGLNSGGDAYDQEYASYVSQKLPKLQSSMQTLEEQMRNTIREEEMSRFKQDVISSIPEQEAAIYEYTPQNFEITDDMYDDYDGNEEEYTSPYGIPSPNIGFAKPTSLLNNQQQMDIIRNTALKYNIPPEILAGVYGAETSYGRHNTMRSSAGAQGPFQFMPSTAKQYGIDPWNFNQASDGAARYLANSFKKTGNWADAVASYNAGLGNVKRWRNIPETASYVPKVFANARSLKGKFKKGGFVYQPTPQTFNKPNYTALLQNSYASVPFVTNDQVEFSKKLDKAKNKSERSKIIKEAQNLGKKKLEMQEFNNSLPVSVSELEKQKDFLGNFYKNHTISSTDSFMNMYKYTKDHPTQNEDSLIEMQIQNPKMFPDSIFYPNSYKNFLKNENTFKILPENLTDEFPDRLLGTHNPKTGEILFNKNNLDRTTPLHEWAHKVNNHEVFPVIPQINRFDPTSRIKIDDEQGWNAYTKYVLNSMDEPRFDYLRRPTELESRRVVGNYLLGDLNKPKLDSLRKNYKDLDGNIQDLLDIYQDDNLLMDYWNNRKELSRYPYQQGGKINDNDGYLNSNLHNFTPHKIINSSHITTNNMAFPIKANGKVLFPNTGDYIFPQNKVLEVPLFKKGGVKKGYVHDPSSLPPAPSYDNLAQTSYNITPVYQPVAKNIQVGSQQPIVTPSVVKRKGLRPVIYPQTPIVQLPPLEYNNLNNSSYQEVTPVPFIPNEAFQTPQYNFLNNKNIINNPFLKSLSRKDRIIASLTSPKFRNNA